MSRRAAAMRPWSRAGICSRARLARLLSLTSQSMEHVVEAVGLALGELGLRLVKRVQLARQGLLGGRGQHDPAALRADLHLVTVPHGNRLPDTGREGDRQLVPLNVYLWHAVLLCFHGRSIAYRPLSRPARLLDLLGGEVLHKRPDVGGIDIPADRSPDSL